MRFLKIYCNSKAIMWIGICEVVLFAIFHVTGSTTAKWYFLGWMTYLIILLSLRVYFNGSLRSCKIDDMFN